MSIPEQTSGTLEIFSRAIFLGTLCKFVKSVFSDFELLGDIPGFSKYCKKLLSFHTLKFYQIMKSIVL